jgi:acetyltransferase-like isoleucine patch superfamily enzyme
MALVISIVPSNILRIFMYNSFMGFRVSYSSKVGWGTIILAKKVSIEKDVRIGKFNRFFDNFELVIGSGTTIGRFNEFYCTLDMSGTAICKIGNQVRISSNHFFDATGGLVIKDFVKIAGRGSQFWTHGGQRKNTAVVLNEKCYIASAVRISQGVEIAENSFIGLGSVVVETFDTPNVLIFGNPAKILKTNITARLSLSE